MNSLETNKKGVSNSESGSERTRAPGTRRQFGSADDTYSGIDVIYYTTKSQSCFKEGIQLLVDQLDFHHGKIFRFSFRRHVSPNCVLLVS